MRYSAYIFDFDYTLGDSTNGIVLSANYALKELGFPPSGHEEIRKTVGLTLPETFERLTGIRDEALGREFSTLFKHMADLVMVDNTELYPDTVDMLKALKNAGAKTGIVTTKFHYRIEQILDKFQIRPLVDGIVGSEDVNNAKPDPEGLLRLIDTFHISGREAVMIGDSVVDAETARNASVDFVAVTTGTTGENMFSKYPCKKVIGSLSELMEH